MQEPPEAASQRDREATVPRFPQPGLVENRSGPGTSPALGKTLAMQQGAEGSGQTVLGVRAVSKEGGKQGTIKKRIVSKMESIVMLLYKPRVHPHLQYGAQLWLPQLSKDRGELEKVQRRARRLTSAMEGLPYAEKLSRPTLPVPTLPVPTLPGRDIHFLGRI